MSVAGLGSVLGSVGSQYDFTKMSNKELFQAAQTLQSEGQITVQQMATMEDTAQGVNSVSINGTAPTGAEVLNQSGSHDFLSHFQDVYTSMKETPGSVGAGLYGSLVDVIKSLEGSASNGSGLSTEG